MKKDLNLLKYKDVTAKTSTNANKSMIIFVAIALILISATAFLLLKNVQKLNKIKDDNIKNEKQLKKYTQDADSAALKNNKVKSSIKDLENINKDRTASIITAKSHELGLNYGILQDIIEKPNGKGKKSKYGSLTHVIQIDENIGLTMGPKQFLVLSSQPRYSISETRFETELLWTVYIKFDNENPSTSSIDIFDKGYIVEKYRTYLDEMLVKPLKINDDSASMININNFQQGIYSGTGTNDPQLQGYKRFTIKVNITIDSRNYVKVTEKLQEIYGN